MVPFMRLLWPNFCIYIFMLLLSFSVFSAQRSLKLENENNNTKTDRRSYIYGTKIAKVTLMELGSLELRFIKKLILDGWNCLSLELSFLIPACSSH